MASFSYPPLTPDPDPAPLSPSIPLNPPMVGEASPFIPADGQNRDLILDSIRAWIRHSLLQWTKAWQAYLEYWLALVGDYLNTFVTEADEYITEHAISGYSWRVTATPINPAGTTNVTLTGVDQDHRPVVIGDLVSDETPQLHYGIVTALIDPTHATVTYLGVLHGDTVSSITAGAGILVDSTDPLHPIVSFNGEGYLVAGANIGLDFETVPGSVVISSTGGGGGGGGITSVIPGTNVTVNTADPSNPIVSAGGGSAAFQLGAAGSVPGGSHPASLLVVGGQLYASDSGSAWHRVAYADTIMAGTNVTITYDASGNPIINASGGGGGGVALVHAGAQPGNPFAFLGVDNTDPANPLVYLNGAFVHKPADGNTLAFRQSSGSLSVGTPDDPASAVPLAYGDANYDKVRSVVAGANIAVDNTDPHNPIVSADGVPGTVGSVTGGSGITVDNTDPSHPIVSFSGSGGVSSVTASMGSHAAVDNTDPTNPKVNIPILDAPQNGVLAWDDTTTTYGIHDGGGQGLRFVNTAGDISVILGAGDPLGEHTKITMVDRIVKFDGADVDGVPEGLVRISNTGIYFDTQTAGNRGTLNPPLFDVDGVVNSIHSAGSIVYSTQTNKLLVYTGSTWETIASA